jgi:bifunctional oligoribonuclease and PAP phosphatase NrnA
MPNYTDFCPLDPMENLAEFKELLQSPKKVAIVTHFKPDADALGSSLGLAGFLRKKGHEVTVISPSDYPDFLAWLPGHETVIAITKSTNEPRERAEHAFVTADIIFCLDFSSLSRIHDLGSGVKTSRAIKVMIDHHQEPEDFAQYRLWDVSSASTAGLIFELIDLLGEKSSIDMAIATCLYAGLMTDTGGFRHNNTRHKEFLIAAELVARGANPHEISKNIYDTNTLERLRMTGFALYEKLVVLPEFNTTYMAISAKELHQFQAQTGDLEGLVNYGLSIKGIKMAVLMYDRKEEIKLSFRSLGNFSVSDLARAHFEGGGHHNAAGGSSKMTLEKTLEKFLSILPQYKQALNP